jgi:phosphoribosylaminoimidazolecarboxamide formyltransferase/IMP cyclohydrolase
MTVNNDLLMTPKKAIISVSDKKGIEELAKGLTDNGVEIYSTGGTKKAIASAGIPVKSISELTGFPEIMGGRVKTLHPKVHGGILADLSLQSHLDEMRDTGIQQIDIVVVNLYPFAETLKKGGSHADLIENIDIGGPTMVRASAKNYRYTTIITDPNDYDVVLSEIKGEGIKFITRERLASKAFLHTAEYDTMISGYFSDYLSNSKSDTSDKRTESEVTLRYGENPHQEASLKYSDSLPFDRIFEKLHGKDLSYNNIIDIDASAALINEFKNDDRAVCSIIKHTNPCGVGAGQDISSAFDLAFKTDNVSPFGGIITVNRSIDAEFAEKIHSMFMEVVIAPGYDDSAMEILTKKRDRRLLTIDFDSLNSADNKLVKSVYGGELIQQRDGFMVDKADLKTVTKRQPTDEEMIALMFNWKVCKHVKSNAIVFGDMNGTLGIGAGQMSRVDSSRIAVEKSKLMGLSLKGSVVASDAFFPFADGLEQAAEAGASAVIQPGGSVRDEEVIAAADRLGVAMVFTGNRHFKH